MRKVVLVVAVSLLVAKSAWCPWGIPKNLGPKVNWAGQDYYPSISSDGTRLYFTSCNRPGGLGDDDIWISTWDGSQWGVPVNAGPNVNSVGRDLSPSISSDGTKLYFVSWGRPGGYGMYDVWVSTRQDTIWGPAVNVGPNVNSPASEFTARVSFDGRELYVASKRDGGFGDYDIWVCLWDSITGEWGPAANLGPRINSFSREYCASPSIDGKTLYFAGWGAGLGYVDIYVSQWQDTAWGQPVNLGSPVNTATWDNGPSISSDGLKLYFASSRDTMDPADQDIWVSEWRGPGVDEGLKKDSVRPHGYELLEGAPNPFSFGTIIVFAVPEDCWMELSIHNTCGSRVAMLANGSYSTGYHSLLWNALTAEGNLLPSGVYFCCLNARGCSLSRKLIIVR